MPKPTAALTEDAVALIIGLAIVALALVGAVTGTDLFGWVVASQVYTNLTEALAPATKSFAALGSLGSLAITFAVLVAVLTVSAAALGLDTRRFAPRVAVVLAVAYASWPLRQLCPFRCRDAGRLQEVWHRLVVAPDQ